MLTVARRSHGCEAFDIWKGGNSLRASPIGHVYSFTCKLIHIYTHSMVFEYKTIIFVSFKICV